MTDKLIEIKYDDLIAFIHGTITFDELTSQLEDLENLDEITFICICDEPYEISLMDIREALTTQMAQRRDAFEILSEWWDNLYWVFGDLIHLPKMIGEDGKTIDFLENGFAEDLFFYNSESDLAKYVVDRLVDLANDCDYYQDNQTECYEALQDLADMIDNFKINQGRPHREWICTHAQKERLISVYNENNLADAEEDVQLLYKKYLEELAGEGNAYAIQTLGYAHYGDDHPLYSCDWEKSRDCFLKLMEIGDDDMQAQSANTLGYIYYYGRCSGGEPQYDLAYKYFSLAAFFGYYEATYKVGDMLRDGKGIYKNEKAAFNLYTRYYEDSYREFIECGDGVLSDLALRIASCYQHGVGTNRDLMTAYAYYLIARVAIDERMQHSDFFGLGKVSASIRSGLYEVKQELGEYCQQKTCGVDIESFIQKFMFGEYAEMKVVVKKKKKGYKIILARTLGKGNIVQPYPYLLILPLISYCKKATETSFVLDQSAKVDVWAPKRTFYVDCIKIKKDGICFYYHKKKMMSVDQLVWNVKAEKSRGAKKTHQFVSVQFEGNERNYDYICDGFDVKPGDFVTVPGRDGEADVRVIRVFEQSEAEAALKIKQYKKILGVR